MEIQNKTRFWTGIAMLVIPMVNAMIYGAFIGLSKINLEWFTWKVFVGLMALIWVSCAIALIWSGTKTEQNGKTKHQ
jgi:hypothetical protein